MLENLPKIIVLLILISWLLLALKGRRRTEKLIREKVASLGKTHKKGKYYICTGAEQIDKDLIQFYGLPYQASVTPGMKIETPDGYQYKIKEVYADDSTPDKPDAIIPSSNKNTAILIETKTFNWNSFNSALAREKILALRII